MGVAEAQTDEALMRAYVGGDKSAFPKLFQSLAPRITQLGRRHGLNEDEVRDLVQQTFLQMHRARHDFKLDLPLRPWVVTIALNLVRQVYRKRTRRKENELDETRHRVDATAVEGLVASDQQSKLRAAVASLPEKQRQVIELHWFEDRSFAEVAEMVGAREGAVRVRAHRAYERLRTLLSPEDLHT